MTNKLKGLSDIYRFFRKNETPIYFISPTAYNVLGLGQWVQAFRYVTFFDSFDGEHFRITNPKLEAGREFQSMEEIVNYLLSHKDTADLIASHGKGKVLTVMFDEETEQIANSMGLEMALPPAKLRQHIDSKIVTTQLANEAGVPCPPNLVDVQADSYEQLMQLVKEANLGDKLVIQTPYGDSGKTTFFVNCEADWDKNADKMIGESLKIMKYINHIPGTVEAVATRCGTLVGPLQTDITGYEELTPFKGGWCGNDIFPELLKDTGQADKVINMVKAMGDKLYENGYRGTFCFDYLIDTDDGEVYLGEINPRVSGASPMTNLVTSKYGGAPLMLFHLLEFMDVDFEIDVDEIQARWADYTTWTQLVLKHTEDKVRLITKAPQSGIWRMQDDGEIKFLRKSINWSNIGDERNAFYMRVYAEGDYSYLGADMGILVTVGRMQSDDRALLPRAQQWIKAINNQFEYQDLDQLAMPDIPSDSVRKML